VEADAVIAADDPDLVAALETLGLALATALTDPTEAP
jgi:adenine/guanine phosphoribosyltransferase-like PRPP-binding protein